MTSLNAIAQDSALPNRVDDGPKTIEEQLGLKKEEKRKSTGDIKKDYALQFFEECSKRNHPMINEDGRRLLCSCTAQEMQRDMPFGDMVALFSDRQKAPILYRNILKTYYARCTKHAVRESAKEFCLATPSLQEMKKERDVCECTADTLGRYMNQRGESLMMMEVERQPNILDPLSSYMETPRYQSRYDMYLKRCIEIHVYGYR